MGDQEDQQSKQNYTRQPHYIPKFYLKGFTLSGSKNDFLWVLDKESTKQWPAKPKNIAHQRDFYRVEFPGVEPGLIEDRMAAIETQAATVIRKIIDEEEIPEYESEEYVIFVNLVALMAARVPSFRSAFSKPMEEIGKFALQLMLASPERWESTKAQMKRDGYNPDDKISYEQMKSFVNSSNYSIEIDRVWHLKNLIDSMDIIMPLLMERKWSLAMTKNESDHFICSDNPVTLMWTKPVPAFWGPGFGMPDTELMMPLNKNIALLAIFEGEPRKFLAPTEVVAKWNTRIGMHSHRFLYSSQEDFIWQKRDGGIGDKTAFIEEVQSAKTRS